MKHRGKQITALLLCILLTFSESGLYLAAAETESIGGSKTEQEALPEDSSAEANYADLEAELSESLLEGIEEITITADNLTERGDAVSLLSAEDSFKYGAPVVKMDSNATATFEVDVPKAGGYLLNMAYYIPESYMQDLLLSLKINGKSPFYECRNLQLKAVWKDASQEYEADVSGNEMYPLPERVYRWEDAYFNSTKYNSDTPYIFYFQAGRNTVTISNNDVPFILGAIKLQGKQKLDTYEEYTAGLDSSAVIDAEPVIIEGEHYTEKSDSYIRPERGSNVKLHPYSASSKLIHALAGGSWQNPGQWVTYSFDIESSGIYYIAVKYFQKGKEDMPSMKKIYVDGQILFDRMADYPFAYTGDNPTCEVIRVDGEQVGFYLEAGTHTITLESVSGPYEESYTNLMSIVNKITTIALNIQYVTGNRTDENRDWKIENYIPNIREDLLDSAETLESEYEKLSAMSGKADPVLLADLGTAARRLRKFADDLNYMINHMSQFSTGDDSVGGLISTVVADLLSQPLMIDQIYVTPDTTVLPSVKVGFFRVLVEEIKKLFLSFFSDYSTGGGDPDKETLSVWVNHATTNVEVIRQLTESGYLPNVDYNVNLSVMADETKLLLAVSAGNAPDLAIGLSYYQPYQLALRGALADLTEFDGFTEILDDYAEEFFIPFIIDDACYALPEALNFNLMFYRKDILNQLGLAVPKSWDDVMEMLPVLSQYGMSFCTRIATDSSLKTLGSTFPYFSQMGASIFSEDGLSCALGSEEAVSAFNLMCDLYTKYSLPTTVANFYNSFKSGTTPIGIGDMTTYILLRNAAPEIAGQWGIAPVVGTEQEDGTVNNNMWAVNTASSVIAGSNMKEEAWDYLKWFMSTEIQTQYVNNMQLTFGSEFIWASANLKAFVSTTAYSQEDLDVVMEQIDNCAEITLHPSYVIAQRAISDAWNAVVFDGDAARTSLDSAIKTINRDITKKLKEFGYIGDDGQVLSPYSMPGVDTVHGWKTNREQGG